jgi:chaperonin cofactor prefoldin
MMQDDDSVMYSVGDCFMVLENDDAGEAIEEVCHPCMSNLNCSDTAMAHQAKVLLQTDADKLREQYATTQARMSELRAMLYAKFGKSIRLE